MTDRESPDPQVAKLPLYSLSGKFGLLPILLALVGAIPAVAGLAAVHAFLGFKLVDSTKVWFSWFANSILALVFGAALGWLIAQFLRGGRNRNTKVALLLSCLLSAWGLYTSWVVWTYLVSRDISIPLPFLTLLKPAALGSQVWLISVVRGKLYWRSMGASTSIVLSCATWLLEAVVVVGISARLGTVMATEPAFCEGCRIWCKKLTILAANPTQDDDTLNALFARGDFASLEPSTPDPTNREPTLALEVRMHFCPRCGDAVAVAVDRIKRTPKIDKDDRMVVEIESRRSLIPTVAVNNGTLRGLLAKIPSRPAAQRVER